MDNFDDLKALWHTAKTDDLPSSEQIMQLVTKFRRQKLRRKWMMIISAFFFSGLLTATLITSNHRLATTYIGGLLMVATGIMIAVREIRSLKRFRQLEDQSNLDFVAFLEQTRRNQLYHYKKTMVLNVTLSSAGWFLYMYESVHRHPLWLFILYGAFTVYLAVMWFVVRPRSFKKNAAKLDATRERLNNILNQLKQS